LLCSFLRHLLPSCCFTCRYNNSFSRQLVSTSNLSLSRSCWLCCCYALLLVCSTTVQCTISITSVCIILPSCSISLCWQWLLPLPSLVLPMP
jgi:hypothetical protein